MLMSSTAFADGFVCYSTDGVLKVTVLNHVNPDIGTRTGAIMVVSDRTINAGKRTIATFTDEEGTVSSFGAEWTATVSEDIAKKGRNIAGTKLGFVDKLIVDVDHSYSRPVEHGARVSGKLIVKKTDGASSSQDLSCFRYLKN